MRSDMHIHTTYSDGSLSPAQVVALAASLGIGEIAITDHDTMAGWEEGAQAGRALGVRVTTGIEISAFDRDRGRKVHLLGYAIQDRQTLEKACEPFLASRHEAQLLAAEKVAAAGYPITRELVLSYAGPGGWLYRQHIMHALVDRGYAGAIYGQLYRTLFAKEGLAFVPSQYMDVFTALALIRETGGQAVLAHPYQYDSIDLLPELVGKGLTGLETGSSKHAAHEVASLRSLAQRYGLESFTGSDFHGFYNETPNPLGSTQVGEITKKFS